MTLTKEEILILAPLISFIATFLAVKVTGQYQIHIAKINAEKDLSLQYDRIYSDRIKEEVQLKRNKLEELHKILSRIHFENSLTMSYIQSNYMKDVSEFRQRYFENCSRMHDALSISDLYYPDMTENIKKVYSQTNLFWGYQENVIEIDIKKNQEMWSLNVSKVIDVGDKISKYVSILQNKIVNHGQQLGEKLSI